VGIQLGNRLLDTLEANEIFGEMALIDDKPRSATAIALTDVALIPISEMQFLLLVTRKPARSYARASTPVARREQSDVTGLAFIARQYLSRSPTHPRNRHMEAPVRCSRARRSTRGPSSTVQAAAALRRAHCELRRRTCFVLSRDQA
jgi:CRP-like cAMP-binding protein